MKLGDNCTETFLLSLEAAWFLLPGTETQDQVPARTFSLGCDVGGVPGRKDCGERSGACGLPGHGGTGSG